MSDVIKIDLSEYQDFFDKMKKAGDGGLKKEFNLFLEGLGVDFLRIVQDEIIRREVLDTRLLLSSFSKGDENGFWEISEGDFKLEVGTNIKYAALVNDGHWTVNKEGVNALRYKEDTKNGKHKTGELKLFNGVTARFIPGDWKGDKFVYNPKSKTGMILKQQWVKGSHYWESAIKIMEKSIPKLLDQKIQQWFDKYFG